MSLEIRTALAEQQANLVLGLTRTGEAPQGFVAWQFQEASIALAQKRMRSVAKAWPRLVEALGKKFGPWFESYSRTQAYPSCGGALADGRFFAKWLQSFHQLPEAGRIECLWVDLHWKLIEKGLIPRKGPMIKILRLPKAKRLVFALRIPWFGEWVWGIPLG